MYNSQYDEYCLSNKVEEQFVWPLKVKAFSEKVPEDGDVMEMNPFELPENSGLSRALKEVRVMATQNAPSELDPDEVQKYTTIRLQFIEIVK